MPERGSLSRLIGSEDSSGWSAALSLKPACNPDLPSSLYFPVYRPARSLVWMFSFSPPSRYLPVAHGRSPDLIAPVWLPDVIKRLRISTLGSLMESGVRCIVWKMPRILPLSDFRLASCSIHPIFPSFWLCARGCDFPPVLCWGIKVTWKCWSNSFIYFCTWPEP